MTVATYSYVFVHGGGGSNGVSLPPHATEEKIASHILRTLSSAATHGMVREEGLAADSIGDPPGSISDPAPRERRQSPSLLVVVPWNKNGTCTGEKEKKKGQLFSLFATTY